MWYAALDAPRDSAKCSYSKYGSGSPEKILARISDAEEYYNGSDLCTGYLDFLSRASEQDVREAIVMALDNRTTLGSNVAKERQ